MLIGAAITDAVRAGCGQQLVNRRQAGRGLTCVPREVLRCEAWPAKVSAIWRSAPPLRLPCYGSPMRAPIRRADTTTKVNS